MKTITTPKQRYTHLATLGIIRHNISCLNYIAGTNTRETVNLMPIGADLTPCCAIQSRYHGSILQFRSESKFLIINRFGLRLIEFQFHRYCLTGLIIQLYKPKGAIQIPRRRQFFEGFKNHRLIACGAGKRQAGDR